MEKIKDIAKKLDINNEDLVVYGDYLAKVKSNPKRTKAKLILVTATSPTPSGEGKTTVSIGLNDAFRKLNQNTLLVLREPSLGPVFGMKGGATGGGLAKILPEEEINLHFTGDFHAITSANNLMCAALDNHIYQGNELNIDENQIKVKRCLDINDRAIRKRFDITAASEVMAIFCLAKDLTDLKRRLGNITLAYDKNNDPVYARDIKVEGAMYTLLKEAFVPNLVQSLEGSPVIVHGGPFANIAHGCNSLVATKLALGLGDYVITEAGFASDLGAEKFLNIKCKKGDLTPDTIVLVTTIKALKHTGIENLRAHVNHLTKYKVPLVVTINKFLDDTEEEIEEIIEYCRELDIDCIISNSYNEGGNGSVELAKKVMELVDLENNFSYLYEDSLTIEEKLYTLSANIYHAGSIVYSDKAKEVLAEIKRLGLNHYPVCIAKTPYSLSDDPKKLGYPTDYELNVKDIIIRTGSEMIVILLNDIITMPGMNAKPNYENY